MKDHEHGTTGLLLESDKLRSLITRYPDLPLVVLAGQEASDGEHSTTFCSSISCYVGEFLDCNQTVNETRGFTDREEFEKELRDELYRTWEEGTGNFSDYVQEELESYEPYWKPCIVVYVNN